MIECNRASYIVCGVIESGDFLAPMLVVNGGRELQVMVAKMKKLNDVANDLFL